MARPTGSVTLSDGRSLTIRQLSWLQLRASRNKAQVDSAKNLIALGGAEFSKAWKEIKEQRDADAPQDAQAIEAESDVLAGHDLYTVLIGGIVGGSAEQIEDLSEPDAEKVGRAILDMNPKPPTQEEEKNVSSPSTCA